MKLLCSLSSKRIEENEHLFSSFKKSVLSKPLHPIIKLLEKIRLFQTHIAKLNKTNEESDRIKTKIGNRILHMSFKHWRCSHYRNY